jgi:hypothetical protein
MRRASPGDPDRLRRSGLLRSGESFGTSSVQLRKPCVLRRRWEPHSPTAASCSTPSPAARLLFRSGP